MRMRGAVAVFARSVRKISRFDRKMKDEVVDLKHLPWHPGGYVP
jgi:hypothetical protein